MSNTSRSRSPARASASSRALVSKQPYLRQLVRLLPRLHPIDLASIALILMAAFWFPVANPAGATAFATLVAAGAGGYWTYTTYMRRRATAARGRLDLKVAECKMADGRVILRATLGFENVGESLIKLSGYEIRFQTVLPVDETLPSFASIAKDSLDQSREAPPYIEWPLLRCCRKSEDALLEPGETELFFADAVLPPHIEVVRIYGFVENQRSEGFGWVAELMHSVGVRT